MIGWAALAAVVAVYDCWALRHGQPTMSAVYDRARCGRGRWPVTAATVIVVAHLHRRPRRLAAYDPLRRLAGVIKAVTPPV